MTTYDHVIVGGGTTGCVLAARLSKDPSANVLMIEAGPDYKTPEETPTDLRNAFAVSVDKHDWHYKAETYQGRMIDYARAKCTGGCSAVNGSIALRGLPADYNQWAEWGNTDWHWDKLLPYFKRVEDDPIDAPYHGKGGPLPIARMKKEDCWHIQQAFVDACMANGEPFAADHNEPTATGVGPLPMNRRGDLRISTAIAYLTPEVRRRKNLTILPDTLAVRILFEGKRAVGVEVRARARARRRSRAAPSTSPRAPCTTRRSCGARGSAPRPSSRSSACAPSSTCPGWARTSSSTRCRWWRCSRSRG